MSVQLAQQAQEIRGQRDVVMITERVDDVALLIGQMVTMGLPEIVDRHIPRPWTHRGLRWGWTAVRLLASAAWNARGGGFLQDTPGHAHAASYTIVGVLQSSDTPLDRALFVPLDSYWHLHQQDEAAERQSTVLPPLTFLQSLHATVIPCAG